MSLQRKGGSREPDLVPRSKRPAISLPDNHPMVVLTDAVDSTKMEVRAGSPWQHEPASRSLVGPLSPTLSPLASLAGRGRSWVQPAECPDKL
jgi:hypothetical protein